MVYRTKRRRGYHPYRRGRKRLRTFRKKGYIAARARKRRFTASVKKLIRSTAEVKRTAADPLTYTFNSGAGANATMSTPVDLPQLFLSIPFGVNDGDRVGEQIRTKKAILKLLLHSPISEQIVLQVFVGYFKTSPGTLPSAASLLNIFDDGGGVAPADGTLLSLMRSVNTDQFRIISYTRHKLGPQIGGGGLSNNDFPIYKTKYIDLTKALGTLKFSHIDATPPTNKHLYLFMNWVQVDGAISGGAANDLPRVQYYLDYTYTDI